MRLASQNVNNILKWPYLMSTKAFNGRITLTLIFHVTSAINNTHILALSVRAEVSKKHVSNRQHPLVKSLNSTLFRFIISFPFQNVHLLREYLNQC